MGEEKIVKRERNREGGTDDVLTGGGWFWSEKGERRCTSTRNSKGEWDRREVCPFRLQKN